MSTKLLSRRVLRRAPCSTARVGTPRRLRRPPGFGVVGFCGIGGWCKGMRKAGIAPRIVVNHCDHAIELHKLNHPEAKHYREDVFNVDIKRAVGGRTVDWCHISPDCTDHSDAKGARPRSAELRGLARVLVNWCRQVRPTVISLENVSKFVDWCRLDVNGFPDLRYRGEYFQQFLHDLRALGYNVEWRMLVAADYGTPTSRERLYLVGRCDGERIRWPKPTHGPGRRHPWRTAADCMNWDDPTLSIFERPKPLVRATQLRMALGMMKYLIDAVPYWAPPGAAMISAYYGSANGKQHHCRAVDQPLPTITTWDHNALVVATAVPTTDIAGFLIKYYKEGGQWCGFDEPLHTITCHARFALVAAGCDGTLNEAIRIGRWLQDLVPEARLSTVEVNGRKFPVVTIRRTKPDGTHELRLVTDVGMRMLRPRELARAQGFDDDFILTGTDKDQIERIGNSLCVQVAEAIVRANNPRKRAPKRSKERPRALAA